MERIDSRSYPAIAVFSLGMILIFVANFKLQDVHVPTVIDAITRLGSEENKRVLLLWGCALFGVALQASATMLMGKVTWENINYSYDVNIVFSIITTILMAIITVVSIYYTSLAVLGLIIIIGFIWLWANSDRKQ